MNGLWYALWGDWPHPFYAAVKALALFFTAAAAFRLSERRTMAEFTPFDWVTAVAAGAIVGRSATAADTSWLTGTAALLTLVTVHGAVARLRFNDRIRALVDPPVRVLVRNGELQHANLRRARITVADLDAMLRQHGLLTPSDVELALFESKGSVSVFRRIPPDPGADARPL